MNRYKYKKTAGALQEAYEDKSVNLSSLSNIPQQRAFGDELAEFEQSASFAPPPPMAQAAPSRSRGFRTAETTGTFSAEELKRESVRAQSSSTTILPATVPHEMVARIPMGGDDGLDPNWDNYGGNSMFFYTVEEGQKVLMVERSGEMNVIEGPARVWSRGRSFRPMLHYVAHPAEFLIVRFRDGEQKHMPGPAHVWKDPRVHQEIAKEESLPIADKEAVIVYTEGEDGKVTKRIVHGPATFVPKPGEWLHTFKWHGNVGGRKVPGALEFQKLWLLPDQMYHDVPDVRTADDAVLTIRLMMFFELSDIETMLSTTHDPIGDFLNAATSDVVDFVGRHSFESFKQNTEKLNETATYKQLMSRGEQIGYKINRVVYRGYGAKASLEQMHDQAIESRTRLQLEKATEQQAQELEDLKLERDLARATKQRGDQANEADAQIELTKKRQAAEREHELARRQFAREQARLDAEQRDAIDRQNRERDQQHLGKLSELGVDLTKFLTANQADQVIELRGNGASAAHVHLPKE